MRFCLIGCVFLAGCSLIPPKSLEPQFVNFYKEQKAVVKSVSAAQDEQGKRLTLSAQAMPLTEFLRWLSNETGISVVCAKSLDNEPVTVDIVSQGVDGVLSVVARRLGVQVTRTSNVYYIGQLSAEDRGVLVRRVSRLKGQELVDSVTCLLSENGRVTGYDDGLVVVGDKVEILQRVAELFDGIEQAPSDAWFIQFFLFSFHNENLLQYGVDLSIDASLSVDLFDNSDMNTGFLTAALKASQDDKLVTLVSNPFFVLADGYEAGYVSGQNVPIPKKTVSDAGTITTTGYDYQQTGLQFAVRLRQVQSGKAALYFNFESSTIVDYIEAAPITLTEKFDSTFNLQSNQPYLVGSVKTSQQSDRVVGFFNQTKNTSGDTLQIWCKAYKID